ncbi:sporulation histidine kinase inhibitor Sda [Mesobacillus thioparans]|uniref:sporulation histidine kinase inhibitor Sda n=1 Tax=Mesobacillus thioparans TaxID=370439 RepID=UPI0039F0F4EE
MTDVVFCRFLLEKYDKNISRDLQKLNKIRYNERTIKEGVVTISGLWELNDEKLIEAYEKATLLSLDDSFIEMLIEEIDSRGLAYSIQSYIS